MPPEKLHELAAVLEHLAPHTLFSLGPVTITSTVINTLIIDAVLIFFVYLATRRLSYIPTGVQHILEMAVEFIYGLLEPGLGRHGRRYLWFIGTLFILILTMNLSWFIPGMIPPTTDISTTFGLGVATILTVHTLTARKKGLHHYIQHYLEPSPLLAPLMVIEELVKPFSLAIRLFGNMFGEKMVVTVLFILAPVLMPTPIMLLGVIMGIIQAFVFTLLAVTYLTILTQGH
ncbi:MAG: F0F1 ATP synthase subunit A [Bacillota bacterium]|nr:F0F1 ATP synthase subunit A [Bacillota bacterium]